VARIAAAALACVLFGLGALALADFGARAGLDAAAAQGAADGHLRASGEVASLFVDESRGSTVIHLRAAPGLDFVMPLGHAGRFARGDFVTLEGTKQGSEVAVESAERAQHPLAAASPYLAGGATVAAAVALDVAVPWAVARGLSPARSFARLRSRLRAPGRRGRPSEAPPPEDA
jgi:hypothetical protein